MGSSSLIDPSKHRDSANSPCQKQLKHKEEGKWKKNIFALEVSGRKLRRGSAPTRATWIRPGQRRRRRNNFSGNTTHLGQTVGGFAGCSKNNLDLLSDRTQEDLFCPRKIRRLNTCGYRTPLTFDPGKWNTQDTVLEAGRLKHATVGSLVFTNEKTGPELLWRVIFLHLDFTVMPKSNKQGGVRSGPSEGGLNGGLCSGSEVEFD